METDHTRSALAGKVAEMAAAHARTVELMQPCAQLASAEFTSRRQGVKACLAGLREEAPMIRAARETLDASVGPLTPDESAALNRMADDLAGAVMLSIEFTHGLALDLTTPAQVRRQAHRADESLGRLLDLADDVLRILWPDAESVGAVG